MDKFLKALPGYISSSHTRKGKLDQYLMADYIICRIKGHLMTCAMSVDSELSDEESIACMSLCIRLLWLIFECSRKSKEKSSAPDKLNILREELQLQQMYFQELMDNFQTLCGMDDSMVALHAACLMH
jgi:hypothetical protein